MNVHNPLACFKFLRSTGVLVLIAAQSAIPQSPMPQSPQAVLQLMKELPPCSVLHKELERGRYGGGIDQPYMARMRQYGVQRALLGLRAVLHGNRAEDIKVVRRLYFFQFDGPNSQISDEATLKAIEASGLQAELDGIAHSRVLTAPIHQGVEWWPFAGNRLGSSVEFFANAWLREEAVNWFRSGRPKPSALPVVSGDALGTQALLKSRRFAKKDLDRALFDAAISDYDNSAVIKLLLDAGADVNARTPDGTTPLTNAIDRPCNLRPLLDRGADLNARDKWGRNALQQARDKKQAFAIRVLQEAESKTRSNP